MRRTISTLVFGATLVMPAALRAQSEGTWALRRASAAEQAQGRGEVHVALRAPGLNTFYAPVERFAGLDRDVLMGTRSDVVFTLAEDAGTFRFSGSFVNGQGRGTFAFSPAAAFTAELQRRGYGTATEEQLFTLARHGAGLDLVTAVEAAGYRKPSLQSLVDATVNGADAEYVRELQAAGQRVPDLETLRTLRSHSISGAMVSELRTLGYSGLAADELVQLRNQRLDAAAIRRINEAAGAALPIPAVLQQAREQRTAAGAPTSPVDGTPLAGRWRVHGSSNGYRDLELFWDDDTNWRRHVRAEDLRGFPASGFGGSASPVSVRMEQDAGVFAFEGEIQGDRAAGTFSFAPRRDYGQRLQAAGIEVARPLGDHDLKNLAWGGMSLAHAQQLAGMGLGRLTARDLIDMSIYQVTPDYVRAMRAAGVLDITTPRVAIDLKHGGATPELAARLRAAEQRDVTAQEALRRRRR